MLSVHAPLEPQVEARGASNEVAVDIRELGDGLEEGAATRLIDSASLRVQMNLLGVRREGSHNCLHKIMRVDLMTLR